MTRAQLETICAAIRAMKARSDRFTDLKAWLEEQRDAARLQTTKTMYQAIIDRMEAET